MKGASAKAGFDELEFPVASWTPSQPGRFTVGGETRCRTPHGIILLPPKLESK